MPAGGTVSKTVELGSAFDVTAPGHYVVTFEGRAHDVAAVGTTLPRRYSDQVAVQLPRTVVDFRVSG